MISIIKFKAGQGGHFIFQIGVKRELYVRVDQITIKSTCQQIFLCVALSENLGMLTTTAGFDLTAEFL